jgi:hypothetical protein
MDSWQRQDFSLNHYFQTCFQANQAFYPNSTDGSAPRAGDQKLLNISFSQESQFAHFLSVESVLIAMSQVLFQF